MEIVTFTMPLDASFYDFKWSTPQELTVKYGTCFDKGKIAVEVFSVDLGFSLLFELNNKKELRQQIEAAAKHNAQTYWLQKGMVKPRINVHSLNEHFQHAFTGLIY
jgi:hypothetical protein